MMSELKEEIVLHNIQGKSCLHCRLHINSGFTQGLYWMIPLVFFLVWQLNIYLQTYFYLTSRVLYVKLRLEQDFKKRHGFIE